MVAAWDRGKLRIQWAGQKGSSTVKEEALVALAMETAAGEHCCAIMATAIEDRIVRYSAKVRQYGLPFPRQSSIQRMAFCPFCGSRLPLSLRDRWFEESGCEASSHPCGRFPNATAAISGGRNWASPPTKATPILTIPWRTRLSGTTMNEFLLTARPNQDVAPSLGRPIHRRGRL